jgi:hypothetical protein
MDQILRGEVMAEQFAPAQAATAYSRVTLLELQYVVAGAVNVGPVTTPVPPVSFTVNSEAVVAVQVSHTFTL